MDLCFFNKRKKVLCVLLFILITSQAGFSQDSSAHAAPSSLRRPDRGAAPRYPTDLVIGELGRGEASEAAFAFATNAVSALVDGRRNAAALADPASRITEEAFEYLNSLRPITVRLGGGRIEPDGSTSFLVRFISREESISGELFIRWMDASESGSGAGRWIIDDLSLENKRTLAEIREVYRFNFSPFERFF